MFPISAPALERLDISIKFLYYCPVFFRQRPLTSLADKENFTEIGEVIFTYQFIAFARQKWFDDCRLKWKLKASKILQDCLTLCNLVYYGILVGKIVFYFSSWQSFEVIFFCWLILHILLSCLIFLLLNLVCRFNKTCCLVIHSLQQTDEITPIDPTRTSEIGCFLNPFILFPPQSPSHLLVFFLFKHSALRKKMVQGRLSVPSCMFKGNFLYLWQLKYLFQWVNIILELLKRTKAQLTWFQTGWWLLSEVALLVESGSGTKKNKKHVTPPKENVFPANPGKIKEQTWLQIWSKN